VGEETTTEAFDSTSKEFSSNLPNQSSASVSDQASKGQMKAEINRSMNADCFWSCLENFVSATDVSCLNSDSPDSLMIKVSQFFLCSYKMCLYQTVAIYILLSQYYLSFTFFHSLQDVLDHYIQLLNLSNPIKMENKNVVEELACLLDEMKQLRAAMSMR
jgi:hypothetical protein